MNINCIVDIASREVSFQENYRIAAYDHNVDVIRFSIEPIEDFSLDLSSIKIAAQGPNKARHDYSVDPSTVSIEEETGYITFDWPIPQGVTEMPIGTFKYGDKGQLIFAVCAEIIDGSTVSKAWHSDDGIITVVAHLEPESGGGEDPEEEATNRQMIGQLRTDVTAMQAEIDGKADKIYVTPEDYGAVGDGVTDDSAAINSAIASGKPVHLDGSKTYAIANMVSILNDCVIFGNGATILENGFESTHLIEAHDSNLTIHDLVIEGDPASEHVITGITIYSCVSQLNNLVVKNATSHSIVISDGKAVLSDIIMNNVGKKGNYSFVYLTENSETNWNNVFAFNDVFDIGPQCFYISSGHHTISNVQVYNTRVLVDVRNGSTTVTNGYCYNTCGVVCQTSGYNEGADITISNVVFDQVIPFDSSNTLISIRVCKNLTLKDCVMIVSESATNAAFLMKFEKPADLNRNVDRVVIDNLNIIGDGIVTNGIYAKNTLASDIILKNCQFPVLSNGSAYVAVTYGSDLARFIFENCTFKNKTNRLYIYDNVGHAPYENVIVRSRYKQRGTTAERPVLWSYYESNIYYDTDLAKLILWNGTAWVNLDGTAL